ncbi:2-amino-4-hydroxy-6-hydroxymethyldihydropteridine diphosphokinase [Pontixanthobacter aestiaquae]|uniref:2-amino-4-hydroxy-6-hydroxymethyldihydropteridine pyrophosphokinase n=1 Tax=Pontixanthobacter aestiaquae TaxID=1509367 RepID=A0A844ZB03_9SPHN|nr:2-amino-4-hydroxy-6-hydroxymethyldihydropteridine diphosphokinase [Pontixanthobacter aestiaquae]MDN3644617.1 2-amino-4-hydroxy-6-hydroxymethyldihydropteridine diphosphokinase [Pontixanthobacter aestiaquae]MXO84376.1 2-amino-4-hydroxy-6-hydroxymethyldihydropteridine diphosphokinase [Pontixanthobacter aestiaquae]
MRRHLKRRYSAQTYLIALGSNIRHPLHGLPRGVVGAAIDVLGELGVVRVQSTIIDSAPLGPSSRIYANAALILESELGPDQLLALLKHTERGFGARRGGRWQARVLDLDIVLWGGGIWVSESLGVPHAEFRKRDFVLGPAAEIAPHWRDPVTSLSLRQLFARLTKPRPITR